MIRTLKRVLGIPNNWEVTDFNGQVWIHFYDKRSTTVTRRMSTKEARQLAHRILALTAGDE